MKVITTIMILIILTSCNSKMNIEEFEFDRGIPIQIDGLNKEYSVYVPWPSLYRLKNISKFKYNTIKFKNESIEFKDELYIRKNKLLLIVDSFEMNNYIGFELSLINEKTSNDFLNLFNKKYKTPFKKSEYVKDKYKRIKYLWIDTLSNKMIYYYKRNESGHKNFKTGEKQTLSETKIIILKLGLIAEIDSDDKRNDPENSRKILKQKPNAFDLLEIFKNEFPEE